MRIQSYSFQPEHIAGKDNRICDALSRLCRLVTETHHYPLPTPRILPMSKKASTHVKQLEILDPLVIDLAAAGAEDATYVYILNNIENGVQGKDLDETSELKTIQGMLGELGVTVLPDGNRLIVRNGV